MGATVTGATATGSRWNTSVEVPPMSKPMIGPSARLAARATATAPTRPPAGPDRIVSLASSCSGACSTPAEVITRRRVAGPSAWRTRAR
jgi:hypothetical protein